MGLKRWIRLSERIGPLMLTVALATFLGPAAIAAEAAAALSLRWEVEGSQPIADKPGRHRTQAVLVLSNPSSSALPASGWSIYFNVMSGTVTGLLPDAVQLDHLKGPWHRLRPAEGFEPLAPGASRRLRLQHNDALMLRDKSPQAPYLVYDAEPERALPIKDFQRRLPERPEHMAPEQAAALVDAPALYAQYARLAPEQALPKAALSPIFPTPLRLQAQQGELRWTQMPRISAPGALRPQVAELRALLQPHLPHQASRAQPAGAPALRLELTQLPGLESPEAYALRIDPASGLSLRANSAAGIARGLQSLRSLLPAVPDATGMLSLPALDVQDAPRFEHRGLMFDAARNFQSKATVLELIDLMARYKLNKLHLHLSDDEGWRIEIRGLPELTEVGARRGHIDPADPVPQRLPPAYGSSPDPADPHGSGFYSRADYIEILRYAAARHIDVIPEIDMPAHARAAVVAMAARHARLAAAGHPRASQFLLRDSADRSIYLSAQRFDDNVMDPGLSSTYAFVEHVVAALVALHREAGVPLRMLHVGGDEQPAGAWEGSPATQALMARHGYTRMAEVWNHFFDRVTRSVQRHGVRVGGWEELGARRGTDAKGRPRQEPNPHFLQRDFTLFVWNNLTGDQDLAYRLANAGYRTVLAPATHLYFDMAHQRDPQEAGHNWAAYVDVDTVFGLAPLRMLGAGQGEPLSAVGRRNIAGIQATLFTETMRTPQQLQYLLMPRMLALAERAWSPEPAWESLRERDADSAQAAQALAADRARFMNQLGQRELPRLDAALPQLHYRIAAPGLRLQDGRVWANHQLPGMQMRYTVDGSEPGPHSPPVTGPIADKGRITVTAFDTRGRAGRSSGIDNP